ncbi:sodium/proton antiporter, NhaA family [Arachidicoccus rhizosphaerae]|uniref:Na(+)/H(+) antiporter NhaA n=1 Tax=Arachidicoccus rhizosphaerae TaxID=551991 RepID=A0A1H4CV10_9BACT|nr:Na+/H+ antiporter NhaA [Arachidicoccus rhizosphaerae]SEA64207.1 sodium/proton antiporter, NhaA family [Arachidicoccus rhizosphaerae]
MTRSPIDQLLRPVNRFIHQEYTSGIVLFASVVIALVWANSPWSEGYHHLWETRFSIGIEEQRFIQPLHVWINDGLMALFFFVIGLELKREFIAGELSTIRKAALPMVGALGGMVVPALIYVAFNSGQPSSHGWGIPMATDIAFALGLLSMAGKHIPRSVKTFLSALAVADDLGAVLVIALFYTREISLIPLGIGVLLLTLLWVGNRMGIRDTIFYLIIGVVIWYFFLLSGVHATIAGVLVAFMIPARTKIDEQQYVQSVRKYATDFERADRQDGSLTTWEQHRTISNIKQLCLDAETPLQKIENALHPWVAFVIMPLFALANAGMHIGSDFFSTLANPVSLGVSFGLVAGKFIGVLLFTWVMVRLGRASLPNRASWKHIVGVALLAGVGFTMSLFITGLAFTDSQMIDEAKYGILLASLLSGVLGVVYLKRLSPVRKDAQDLRP